MTTYTLTQSSYSQNLLFRRITHQCLKGNEVKDQLVDDANDTLESYPISKPIAGH